jgi:hypothetical protein
MSGYHCHRTDYVVYGPQSAFTRNQVATMGGRSPLCGMGRCVAVDFPPSLSATRNLGPENSHSFCIGLRCALGTHDFDFVSGAIRRLCLGGHRYCHRTIHVGYEVGENDLVRGN